MILHWELSIMEQKEKKYRKLVDKKEMRLHMLSDLSSFMLLKRESGKGPSKRKIILCSEVISLYK